jgi:sugar-specific transcriptional regulator TrmB
MVEPREIEGALKEAGLSSEETAIYLTMLKTGPSLASKISAETAINRSHVYQLLERLIMKGFASYTIRENRKYFNAVNPEKLLDIARERERRLKEVIPDLLRLNASAEENPIVEILEGKEGIKTVLSDILHVNHEWLAFGSSGKGAEALPFFAKHWEKEREKQKVPLRGILDNSTSGKKRGRDLSRLRYTQIRYVPEAYANPSSTWIYGDRIVFVIWNEDHPFAIRTISKNITENYRSHFQVLWRNAKK